METLYSKDSSGNVRYWSIWQEDDHIVMAYGVEGGEEQQKTEFVGEGKASRTQQEQIESRIRSRINKKLDKGYVYDVDDAKNNKKTNSLGLLKPMLATPIDKVKNINFNRSALQYKYDGHRCLITKQNGKTIAYSRNGKIIDSIPEILSDISPQLSEGETLDGELYLHGAPLQTITSFIKRRQNETKLLKFYCYDIIDNRPFIERFDSVLCRDFGEGVILVPTFTDFDPDSIEMRLNKSLERGYEGLILRLDDYSYEDSKRSRGLIKIKKFIEDDFIVKDIESSKDGWAILNCITKQGRIFGVCAPGDIMNRELILLHKEKYIGKTVTVKYAGLTQDNIPFHPVALRFIEKL